LPFLPIYRDSHAGTFPQASAAVAFAGGSDLDEKMKEFGPSGIIFLFFWGKIIGI